MSISLHEARSIIRKSKRRVPEGEDITHINLVAMMDMMTILLVFLIMNLTITTSPLNISVTLSQSSTRTPEQSQEHSKVITIAPSAILVEGAPVVKVLNGDVDPSEKTEGQFGVEIGKLKAVLSEHHQQMYNIMGGEEPPHELTIIADKNIPYRLLYTVMFTAGRSNASKVPNGPGFQKYRLIVMRQEGSLGGSETK
jgi:biopolymer transport protein ExbD